MTNCPRCGKTGLQPDSIHTCEPLALKLADYWETRAKELQVWVDENDYVEFGYRPEGLKKEQADQRETAAELRRLHAANMDCIAWFDALKSDYDAQQALLRQALEALEASLGWPHVIEALRDWIREQGEQTDTCTYNILRKKCAYCQCHRSKA